MASMRELADHVIAVANENTEPISNLHLQKIMFFIFGRMVSINGREDEVVLKTYDQHFRRWSYGPVVENIYFNYNHFGGRPILNEHAKRMVEYDQFNDDIKHLLKMDPFQLVELTHKLPSWAQYRE